MYARRLDPSVLAFRLSLHRHPLISTISATSCVKNVYVTSWVLVFSKFSVVPSQGLTNPTLCLRISWMTMTLNWSGEKLKDKVKGDGGRCLFWKCYSLTPDLPIWEWHITSHITLLLLRDDQHRRPGPPGNIIESDHFKSLSIDRMRTLRVSWYGLDTVETFPLVLVCQTGTWCTK